MRTTEQKESATRSRPENVCCTPLAPERSARDVTGQVQILAALADPTRLRIIELLAQQTEPVCVCDIVTCFTLGQPTISHHLRVLREARLVTWEKRGLWVYYALNRETLAAAADYLTGLAAEPAPVALRSA